MSERRRILVLTLIMTMACASVIGIALLLTYRAHFAEERERLAVTAQSQARLIEAIARYGAKMAELMPEGDLGHDATAATLGQIIDAHEDYVGFGETGEFVLARLEGDQIVFQFRHRHGEVDTPESIPLDSGLAEPMHRALLGLSGTVAGLDYRGTMVLAAYEPVADLNMGIVAKIDLAEVRAPFIRAAFIASWLALLIIAISVLLFRLIGNPIITRLEASLKDLKQEMGERKQAEESLRTSEERANSLIQTVGSVILVLSPDYRILEFNETAEKVYGCAREDVLGENYLDLFIPPELHQPIMDDIHQVLSGVVTNDYENPARSRDGTERVLLWNVRRLLGPEGEPVGVIACGRDITERRQMEQRLQIAQYAIDHASDSVCLIDPDGQFAYVNQSTSRRLGYSPEEMLSMGVWDIDPEFPAEAWPNHWADLKEKGSLTFESRHRARDGREFPVEIVASYGEFGGSEYNFAHARDITERKQAEEALRASEEKYRVLVEKNPYGIQETDAYGTITFVNEMHQEMYGYGKESLIGRSVTEFLKPGPQRDELPAYLDMLVNDQPPPTIYCQTILTKEGREKLIDVCWNYRRDATGSVTGFIAVLTDVTVRMRLEEELREKNLLFDAILANAPVCVNRIDSAGTQTLSLGSGLRRLGLKENEIVGVNIFKAYPHIAEHYEEVRESGMATFVDQGVIDGEPWCFQNWLFRDGEINEGFISVSVDITQLKQAEEESRRYEHIVSSSNDMLALLDTNFTYLAANAAYYGPFGKTREELIGHTAAQVFGEEFFETTIRANAERCLAGEDVRYQAWFEFPAHGSRYMDVSYSPYLGTDEEVKGFVVSGRDITEQKRAEGRLRLTQYAIDNTADSVSMVGRDGKFIATNASMSRRLGYSPEEMLSMGVPDIDPEFPAEAWPDHWASLKEQGSLTFESRHRTKDGRVFPVEIFANYVEFEGQEYNFAHARDITERKRAEEEQRESEERFRALFVNAPLSYQSLQVDGAVLEVNDTWCKTLGYPRDEVTGKNFADFLAPESVETFLYNFPCFKEDGEIHGVEFEMVRKDGRHIDVLFEGRIGHNPDGSFKRTHCILQDITERKRTEALIESERSRFYALLEQIPAFVYLQAPDYSIRFANRYYREHFGDTEDVPCYKSLWGRDEPCEVCPTFRVFDTGTPQIWEWTEAPDGRIYQVYDYPFTDTDGSSLVLELGMDITERKRAEEAVEENMRLAQILLDSMPCIALLLRPHSREIVAMNQAARDAGAVVGKTCFSTWPKFDDPCPWCLAPEQWATGEECHVEVEGFGVTWDAHWVPVSEDLFMHYAFDITERKRAEQQTEDSLREKEVLLREIHHRVKNNMQVIVSLLRMHARRSQSLQVQEIFEDCQERVGAMALVHETLYQSEDLARIDFEVYLEKLCQNLARAHGGGLGAITVVPEANDVSLGMDQAVAVGMIVGELVSNAFKHAFPGGRGGRIAVSMRETGEHEVELVVENNGVSLPPEVDPENTDTLGLQLVSATATDELGGTMEVGRGDGTRFTLRFKNKAS